MKTKTKEKKWADPCEHVTPKPNRKVAVVCDEIRKFARKRQIVIKSRIMQMNRLCALVAGTIGYHSGMAENERRKVFGSAGQLIARIQKGENIEHELSDVIKVTLIGIDAFVQIQNELEAEMIQLVKKLPPNIEAWLCHRNQRGFSYLGLATVIGETGDLANYSNPGKLWRRMACAPFTSDGKTHMGSTWRMGKHGKLEAAEWQAYGYSPRRRSIMYVIGDVLCKQNGPDSEKRAKVKETAGRKADTFLGPYRKRFDETKARYKKTHPEYDKPGASHRHGLLLCAKLLLKNLWIEWNK